MSEISSSVCVYDQKARSAPRAAKSIRCTSAYADGCSIERWSRTTASRVGSTRTWSSEPLASRSSCGRVQRGRCHHGIGSPAPGEGDPPTPPFTSDAYGRALAPGVLLPMSAPTRPPATSAAAAAAAAEGGVERAGAHTPFEPPYPLPSCAVAPLLGFGVPGVDIRSTSPISAASAGGGGMPAAVGTAAAAAVPLGSAVLAPVASSSSCARKSLLEFREPNVPERRTRLLSDRVLQPVGIMLEPELYDGGGGGDILLLYEQEVAVGVDRFRIGVGLRHQRRQEAPSWHLPGEPR